MSVAAQKLAAMMGPTLLMSDFCLKTGLAGAAAAVTTHTEGVDSSLYILLLRRFRLFETSALPECDDSDLVADIASKGQMLNKSNRSNARKNFILLYAIICIARQMRDSLEGNVYRLVALLRFL